MHDANEPAAPAQATPPAKGREPWTRPEFTRIRAGDAAFGATPLVPEGTFGTGS